MVGIGRYATLDRVRAERAVAEWNRRHRIGTAVRYQADKGERRLAAVTTSAAFVTTGRAGCLAVVFLDRAPAAVRLHILETRESAELAAEMDVARCPRCKQLMAVERFADGRRFCRECDAEWDGDPDEGGDWSDRDPGARMEREERAKARKTETRKPARRGTPAARRR